MSRAVEQALQLLGAQRADPEAVSAVREQLSPGEQLLFDRALAQQEQLSALVGSARIAEATLGAGTFIHELRHHLAPLLGFAELLRESPGSKRAGEWAEEIARQALFLSELIARHGELLHPEGGEQLLSLASLVEEARKYFGRLPPGVALETELPPSLPEVRARRLGLLHVLLNLLANARDAQQERPGTISVVGRQRGERVELLVADQGSGIEPGARARLFQPLFTTKGAAGTGLGLFLSRALLPAGAELTLLEPAQTPEGAVTCFLLSFPLPG